MGLLKSTLFIYLLFSFQAFGADLIKNGNCAKSNLGKVFCIGQKVKFTHEVPVEAYWDTEMTFRFKGKISAFEEGVFSVKAIVESALRKKNSPPFPLKFKNGQIQTLKVNVNRLRPYKKK